MLANKSLDNSNTVTLKDTLFTLQDDGDATKQLRLQLSGIAGGQTRTLTVPDASTTIGGLAVAQTWTAVNAFSDTTAASSKTTGCVVLSGGLGAAKGFYMGAASVISGNAGVLQSVPAALGTLLQIGGADGGQASLFIDGYGQIARVALRHAGSGAASPTATPNGQALGQVSFYGYGTTGYFVGATYSAIAAETFDDTHAGCDFVMKTVPTGGSTTPSEVLRYLAAGNVKYTNSANFAANNGRTVTVSNVGPASIGGTIARWLKFKDDAGVDSYVPVWQ